MDDFLRYVIKQRFQLPSQPKTSKDPVFWLEKNILWPFLYRRIQTVGLLVGRKTTRRGCRGLEGFIYSEIWRLAHWESWRVSMYSGCTNCAVTDRSFGALYIFDPHLECVSKWNPWVFPTFYESFLSFPEYFRIPKHVKGDVDAKVRDFLSRNRRSNLSLWPQWVHALLGFRVPRRSLWKWILWPDFFFPTNFPMQNKMPP